MNLKVIKILLIEDNPGDVQLVKEVLNEIQDVAIELQVAPQLADGLKIIATEVVNVILLDLNLPDSRHIDTFEKVKKFAINIPIIILSAISDKELIYDALKMGAHGYLIKGKIENEELLRTIRYALWNHTHII